MKFTWTEPDFSSTEKVLDLTKRTMTCAGIWPEKTHELIFTIYTTYLGLQCILAVVDIKRNISDFEFVVAALLENVFNLMAFLKITICRIKRKSLAKMLKEIREDILVEKYDSTEQKMAFLNYNSFSLTFVTLTLIFTVMAGFTYYFMSLAASIEMVMANASYGYRLPNRVGLLIEPTNLISFIFLSCYQFFVVPCTIFGYVGTDCLFVSLVLHVSGQFSALSCKVKDVLENPHDRPRQMKNLITNHIRLIRLSKSLEDDFNLIIMQQMIGNTFQLCLLGYSLLLSTTEGAAAMLFTFCLVISCISSTLLAYCYMGECLIKESTILGDAFYHAEWYNISRPELKLMQICMMRSTKQMQLTSGKFTTVSLSTFTDVLKTSMAYLSLLRSLG